ncbi:hypothetical protein ACUXCC_005576 [Cytobacillus horneckiae]
MSPFLYFCCSPHLSQVTVNDISSLLAKLIYH